MSDTKLRRHRIQCVMVVVMASAGIGKSLGNPTKWGVLISVIQTIYLCIYIPRLIGESP